MNIIGHFIFLCSLHFSLVYTALRISNTKNLKKLSFLLLIFSIVIMALLHIYLGIGTIFKYSLFSILYALLFSKLLNIEFHSSYVLTIISIAISLVTSELAAILTSCIRNLINIQYNSLIIFIIYSVLQITFVFLLFKIKRFRNGYPFLISSNKSIYICNFILIITIILVFTYFFIAGLTNIPIPTLILSFVLFSIILIIVIQQNFILYQKQKLQLKTLKEYEQELSETKQKLSTAIEEKELLVKSNHEFYHRQKALNQKLDLLLLENKNAVNTEFGKDYGNIINRINQLSSEYSAKTHTIPNLSKTNIEEIDDMLNYMQSECIKNNIEFILKIDCDINKILSKFITKSQLETLLGDLIRNSIIAIKHSSNDFKSIMVIFGIKNDSYELCVLDSGIPFEINTLINLGITPSSTHIDEGGTGIGFVTTFETLNSCKASIVINEILNNNYTKSIEIKFDNKCDYTIISNRNIEISNCNVDKRNIIFKDKN